MVNRIPFGYGEFYDYPRMIDFELGGQWYFMRSYFDEENDEYADFYDVYLLPFQSEDEIRSQPDYWRNLANAVHLGQIAVSDVGFDETRRRSIKASVIEEWLSARKQEKGAG